MTAEDLIADNAIAGLLCLGPAAANGLDRDLAGQAVAVRVNGEAVSEGAGEATSWATRGTSWSGWQTT